jgi:mannose-6-phosphate isomerase
MADKVIPLRCDCNNYPWGKRGSKSLAAKLCAKANPDFKIQDDKDYAEMWMGTYPTLPSYDARSSRPLQEILNENPELLMGKTVLDKFGVDLPFLPKVLSIAKALPLQMHPNIGLAKKLHQHDPEKFTDENHKPEIAVALSDFEAFVGFKPTAQIQDLLKLDPLTRFQPDNAGSTLDDGAIRQIVKSLLLASEQETRSVLKGLQDVDFHKYGKQSYILDLLPRLQEQYTEKDSGILVALICMNFLKLKPGDAIFIPADGMHAYLSGDIIECMARSNNVLNTGFCPRVDRDSIDLFVEHLNFEQHDKESPMLDRERSNMSVDGNSSILSPPMSEFSMLVTELEAGQRERVKPVQGPSILVVTQGSGKLTVDGQENELHEGSIYFIGQGPDVELKAEHKLHAYRAFAE